MAAKTWDNGGGDGLWSTATNWSDNAVPATTDALTFDATSVASCTIDNVATWANGTITISALYTGNITQNVAISITGTTGIPATMTWTMNANVSGPPTFSVTGVFTRTTGTLAASISVAAAGTLNLGTDATVKSITTNSGSIVTGDGDLTFLDGTTNLVNGTVWDTSGVTSLLCSGSGTAAHALTIGTSETSLSGVPITVTGSGNFTFTGASYDFNVVAITKGGGGAVTIASSAVVDIGASPTVTLNGLFVNGTLKVSGTLTYTALPSGTPSGIVIASTGVVSGSLTAVNLTFSIQINAAATWPSNVVLNINPNTNTLLTITATAHTFGTCTLTGSSSTALTISSGTSITLAANQTAGFTGTLTVTGTLNLLGDLNLGGGAFTTSASSTLSGTGVIKVVNAAFTMNATCTVANTVGVHMNFTTGTGRTFAGASKTYASFQRSGAGSALLTITGSNTFVGAFTDNDGLVAHQIDFTAATTQTAATWALDGSAGKLLTIDSTTGTNFILTKSTVGQVSCDYLFIMNSTVDVSPKWYAGANSTDGGFGNLNWIFSAPPSPEKLKKTAVLL